MDDETTYGSTYGSPGLGNGAKIGILAGVLAATGAVAWYFRESGPHAEKKASGNTPTYPIGSSAWHDYIAQHRSAGPAQYTAPAGARMFPNDLADLFGVTNNAGWQAALAQVNPNGISWPLQGGQTINIPQGWPWPTSS